MSFELCVIGNDEAALELVCVAARQGRRVISVLPEQRHSAWMMGQALRRLTTNLLADLTPSRRNQFRRAGTPGLLHRLIGNALSAEVTEQAAALEQAGATIVTGEARFSSPQSIMVTQGTLCRRIAISSEHVIIGTGVRRTAVHRPLGLIPLPRPETLLTGSRLPTALCILGGGELGCGLASVFSLFGSQVRLLADMDRDGSLLSLAEDAGVRIGTHPAELGLTFETAFNPSSQEIVDCRRSTGFTEHLGLDTIGIEPDEHGLLWCASNLETWCPKVFGVGDVVGFSSGVSRHPTEQAMRILNRINHRIRRPHFLRMRAGVWATI